MSLRTLVKFAIALALALLPFALAPAARAQVSGKPLAKDEIISLLKNQADVAEVARAARQFGINFPMTPEIEAELRQVGKDEPAADLENLIRVLRGLTTNRSTPPKPGPPSSAIPDVTNVSEKTPLGQVDVAGLLATDQSSQYLAELIRRQGIAFHVSEDFLRVLRDAGGDKVLEDALRSARLLTKPHSAGTEQIERQVVQHRDQGRQLQEKGQFDQAEQEYRAALALEKQNPILLLDLGSLFFVQGKFSEAEVQFRGVVKLWPNSPVARSYWASSLHGKGSLELAIAEQRSGIRLDPDYAYGHSNLGTLLVDKGDFYGAAAEFREALRIEPGDNSYRLSAGDALARAGRVDEGIAEMREAIRQKPDDAWAHNRLGTILGDLKKDFDQDISEQKIALRLNPNLEPAHLGLGLALFHKGNLDQAIPEFRAALQLREQSAPLHSILGQALEDTHDLQGALDEYSKAKQLDPKDQDYQCSYKKVHAQGLVEGGRQDEAIRELREVIRQKPNYSDAHMWLGIALSENKDWEQDIEEQKTALRLNPTLARAHLELGIALLVKSDWDQAASEFRNCLQLVSAYPVAHYMLGQTLEHKKDLAGALDEYSKAKQLDPKNQDYQKAYNHLEKALAESKQPRAAAPIQGGAVDASASTAASGVAPDTATKRHIQSALDYLTKNDLENALSEARAAVLAAPKSGEAHHLLGQVYERRNELPAAMREYTQARDLDPKDSTIQIAIDRVQNALDHSKQSSASGVGGGSVAETRSTSAPDRLEGIYVARETGYAHWYYFKPSGAVALDCDQILVDPDEALAWPTYKIYVEINAEQKGYRPVDCSLGRYRLRGDQIRFNALAFSVDPSRRTKFREGAFEGQKDRKGDERLQTIRGFDVIQIVKAVPLPGVDPNYSRTWVLDRQSDQTGRRLEGEYFNLVMSAPVGTLSTGTAGRANFSPDGQFSLAVETAWEGNAAASPHPGGRLGNGTYEIQGHTIIFHNSDGTVSTRNFGYLGKDNKGREFIAIGGFIWVKGDIFSE